jgi:hypothetical protein
MPEEDKMPGELRGFMCSPRRSSRGARLCTAYNVDACAKNPEVSADATWTHAILLSSG